MQLFLELAEVVVEVGVRRPLRRDEAEPQAAPPGADDERLDVGRRAGRALEPHARGHGAAVGLGRLGEAHLQEHPEAQRPLAGLEHPQPGGERERVRLGQLDEQPGAGVRELERD